MSEGIKIHRKGNRLIALKDYATGDKYITTIKAIYSGNLRVYMKSELSIINTVVTSAANNYE
jgi:hypothetical protein